jgi:hypothetical protein
MCEGESEWEQIGEREDLWCSVESKEYEAIGRHELGEHLAAGAAW